MLSSRLFAIVFRVAMIPLSMGGFLIHVKGNRPTNTQNAKTAVKRHPGLDGWPGPQCRSKLDPLSALHLPMGLDYSTFIRTPSA